MKEETKGPEAPRELLDALREKPELMAKWEALTHLGRRDFIGWIESAKKEETRLKRIGVAIDKLAKGQRRPCCYAVVPMDLYKALGESPEAKAAWSKLDSDLRRDYGDWLEESEDKATRKERVREILGKVLSESSKS